MPIHVDCPTCGQRLRVANFAAGRISKCTACGSAVRVPKPTDMLEDETENRPALSNNQAGSFSVRDLGHRSIERLSGWLDWLADRPARVVVLVLFLLVGYVGVAAAKWALNKATETVPTPSAQGPVDPEPWEGVGLSDANDKVRVTATSVTTEQISYIPYDSKLARKTPKALLKVVLKIENIGPTELKYTGWQPRNEGGDQVARLKDDTGAVHEQAAWDARIVGQVLTATIAPSKSVDEVLIFQNPGIYVKYLKLSLPAEACGGTGTLRIKIPRTPASD
jgi:hypothetical protein